MITMPESFDGMLAELADAAAAVTPLPDVAAVRRRAHERTVRRRMGVSALVLVLLGTCGGTFAAVSARFKPRSEVAASAPGVTAKVTTEATPPTPVASQAAAPTPDAAALADAAAYSAVAGTWQPVKGGQYLIVFPDGEIGMGEAGAWQLCDGELASAGSGNFYVDELACGDYGTAGLKLQSTVPGKELALTVPSRSGTGPLTVSYQRTGSAAMATAGPAVLAKLVGQWSSIGADKRSVLVAGNGTVSLVEVSSDGGVIEYAGMVTGYYPSGVRVVIPCVAKPGGQSLNGGCGVVELQQTDAKQLIVVGSNGSEAFILAKRSTLFATNPQSTASPSTQSTVSGGAGP